MRPFTPVQPEMQTLGFRDRRRCRRVVSISLMVRIPSWVHRRHRAWRQVYYRPDPNPEMRT